MVSNKDIDHGKGFDWGKTSTDYSRYRDIYPQSFFEKLHGLGVGEKGQKILDLGTGTGVLPRGLYQYGADFTGIDISTEQIEQAQKISTEQGMHIQYYARPAESTQLPSQTFDVITACQCFLYFDKSIVLPEIVRLLKPSGLFVTMWVAWLPEEDFIVQKSEELVLKYNPSWTGAGYSRQPVIAPEWSKEFFTIESTVSYDAYIPFTQESWCGRIRACRGIGASLPEDKVEAFDLEHRNMLKQITTDNFSILHEVIIHVYRVR